ncbi:uncharacterized protein LOC110984657 [Acanthaster planci]|uniref:Uncharacterized protein LOC110984657 n=1 Tax=Acanthaster planci TaxID=133434 RepID=A0A8B7Z529_ACAPL|nr:uncharacterized protein LOC110984657 [Acanthaster planci]XP_022100736.1 uncharacterized protein LOC110984657 [Acanthaster planci]XP_022100737.1 uncharacterized protein LOC110984657 [Acanthaster planci]XP_022100738.1 uncharacterized protein LOC110984657 [Acanthaster planci]
MTQTMAANGMANGVISQQAPYALGRPAGRTAKTPHGVPCLLLVSVFQLILGVLCALLGIAAVVMENFIYFTGYPIWSGVLFFCITGILGIVTACANRNKCLIIAFMVMSILASIDAGLMLIPSIGGAASEQFDPSCTRYYENYPNYQYYCAVSWEARMAVDIVIAVVALAEMVFAIVGSACSCYGLSKAVSYTAPDTEMQVRYVPQQQQQRVVTRFVPVINTQQQQQHQPLQLQAVPGPTAVPGGYLVSSPHVGQGLPPTQPVGVASQQAGLPQQHSGRSTPLLSVSQQHSGRSTPQMVYAPQPVGAPVAGSPQPILMCAQPQALAKTEADNQRSGVPVQQAGSVAQQIGVGYQQEGSSSQQSGGAVQQVGMGPGQFQMGTQKAGVGSTQVGMGAPQLGFPPQDMTPQPQGLPRVQPDIAAKGHDPQPAAFPASDKKERDDADQEFGELEMAMGGDEQYHDDKQLLIETE